MRDIKAFSENCEHAAQSFYMFEQAFPIDRKDTIKRIKSFSIPYGFEEQWKLIITLCVDFENHRQLHLTDYPIVETFDYEPVSDNIKNSSQFSSFLRLLGTLNVSDSIVDNSAFYSKREKKIVFKNACEKIIEQLKSFDSYSLEEKQKFQQKINKMALPLGFEQPFQFIKDLVLRYLEQGYVNVSEMSIPSVVTFPLPPFPIRGISGVVDVINKVSEVRISIDKNNLQMKGDMNQQKVPMVQGYDDTSSEDFSYADLTPYYNKMQDIEKILKYSYSDLLIYSINPDTVPASVTSLLSELDKLEEEVDTLSEDLAQVDKSISQFRISCNNIANSIVSLSNSSVDIFMENGANKVKGGAALAALAIKGFGFLSEKKRKQEAKQAYSKRQEELLSIKKGIAAQKLPHITSTYKKFIDSISKQIETIYSREFANEADIEDKSIMNKCLLFKKTLCIAIKSRFLCDTLLYCIEEMRAWVNGKHNSNMAPPSIEKELTIELSSWPSKLCYNGKSWDSYIFEMLQRKTGKFPVPVLSVFSDPCLLRNYVGINLYGVNNCPSALIHLKNANSIRLNPLIYNNPYFIHCKNIYENEFVLPKKPCGFGIRDLFRLLLIPTALFGILMLLFKVETSTLWRIFFIVPILCWLGYVIEKVEQNFDIFFPYVERLKNYYRKLQEFEQGIIKKEDCKEFHIIG